MTGFFLDDVMYSKSDFSDFLSNLSRISFSVNIEASSSSNLEPIKNFPVLVNRPLSIVLDLDETLVHFQNDCKKSKFLVRPYVYTFLKNISLYFEIFIFTAAQQDYADWILDRIDPKGLISHRLYREDCVITDAKHVKVFSPEFRQNRQTTQLNSYR